MSLIRIPSPFFVDISIQMNLGSNLCCLKPSLSIHVWQKPTFPASSGAVAKLITSQPEALRTHTRHVCLVDIHPHHVPPAADFLSRCPASVDLTPHWWEDYGNMLWALSLQRFSFCPTRLDHHSPPPNTFDVCRPVFSQVTHLDIGAHWRDWSELSQMLNLTHSVMRHILKHCKMLEPFVVRSPYPVRKIVISDDNLWDQTDDSRVVFLTVDRLS